MSIIIYGMTDEQIAKQKKCHHQWHGPCIDEASRFFKCTICYCLERDMSWEEAIKLYGKKFVQSRRKRK